MSGKEFSAFRMRNPYCHPQDEALVGRPFWTKEQSLIYVDILKAKKNLFVVVKSIDIDRMEKDHAYFGETFALCQQWGLITSKKDYDSKIIAQFYAMVHYHANEERNMSWMTGGQLEDIHWLSGYRCEGGRQPCWSQAPQGYTYNAQV